MKNKKKSVFLVVLLIGMCLIASACNNSNSEEPSVYVSHYLPTDNSGQTPNIQTEYDDCKPIYVPLFEGQNYFNHPSGSGSAFGTSTYQFLVIWNDDCLITDMICTSFLDYRKGGLSCLYIEQ